MSVRTSIAIREEYVFLMQAVDGFVKLADMGIEGTLNVLMSVNEHTYVELVCQFTFKSNDLADWQKEEIINGCIGAALNGKSYRQQFQMRTYENVVKHMPFVLIAPDGSYSSTWFTCLRMSEVYTVNTTASILKFSNFITSRIKGVSISSLDSDVRDFVESFI
jgi:hypothetical protein